MRRFNAGFGTLVAVVACSVFLTGARADAKDMKGNTPMKAFASLDGYKKKLVESVGEKGYDRSADSYRSAWAIAIRVLDGEGNNDGKKMLIAKWDACLGETHDVPSQICALSEEAWHSELLTDRFWNLIKDTKDKKIIAAACYVIAKRGSDEDALRLSQKRDSVEDVTIKQEIENALGWRLYWRSGDKSNPGPAAAPPKLVR